MLETTFEEGIIEELYNKLRYWNIYISVGLSTGNTYFLVWPKCWKVKATIYIHVNHFSFHMLLPIGPRFHYLKAEMQASLMETMYI